MKKIITEIFLFLILLASCNNSKKSNTDSFASITALVDSAAQKRIDSTRLEKKQLPLPTIVDESFNDFIYTFASDDNFQRQRIVFPLPYYNGEVPSKIEKKYWKHDYLFTRQSFYTLLFDREEDMDIANDTNVNSVQVEWMFLKTRMIKKYYFQRKKGCWLLEAINLRPIAKSDHEGFVDFFARFSTDSLFQCKRIRQPLIFVTNDPDDDFSILKTTLHLNQWLAFKPILPTERLSNINYGQSEKNDSQTKILALNGVGNGFSNILYFRRRAGKWELYKFEDTGV